MLKYLIFLYSLSFMSSAFSSGDHRGGAELLNEKGYAVKASAMLFQTTALFDVDGEKDELPEDNSYQLIDSDFSLSYGVSSNFELSALARFRSVTSTLQSTEATNSGIESLGILAKYAFEPIGNTRYAIGARYRQTLYSNATYDSTLQVPLEEVILGDAGSEYGVDVYLTHTNGSWKWDGVLGYTSVANDLSEEINYNLKILYRFTKLSLLGGLEGIYSLEKDQFSENPLLKPVQSKGASNLFNSINRQKIAPYLGLNYAFDKLNLEFVNQTVVSGRSTDQGNAFILSLGWNTQGITAESKKVGTFKEYHIDGSVLKVSARGNFIKIDQGLSTDVEKGMKFDIYQTDYFGGNVLVASGIVYEIGADWSVIKLLKKYKDIAIKPGFAARGY